MSPTVKKALPWLLSLAIVAWLFWSVDLGSVVDALKTAHWGVLVPWLFFFTVAVFVADSATLWVLFARLLRPVGFRDVLAVKGVSYFLNAINYSAGSGAIAYFLHKKQGVSFLRALSTLLWLNFIDVTALLLLLSGGALFGSSLLPPRIAAQLPTVLFGGWAIVLGALSYWHLGVDWLVLGKLRDWRIFHAFRDATLRDYVSLLVARLGFVSIYVFMNLAMLPTFDIHIGLTELLVYVPILTFVQIVPASVSGLGAIQAVMILLFSVHAADGVADPRAQVLAYSTVIGPATTLLRLGFGYAFIHRVARELIADEAALSAAREADDDGGEDAPPGESGPTGRLSEEPGTGRR